MTVKHFRPGDPEFQEIAKTVTPIHRVQNSSGKSTYIDAEPGRHTLRRRESINLIK